MIKLEYGKESADVSVGTSSQTIYEINGTAGMEEVSGKLYNSGAVALVAFKIQRKLNSEDSNWEDFFGGADWLSATNGAIVFISTTKPHTLAALATASFTIRIEGAVALRLCATADTGGTTVRLSGNVQ